MLTCLESACYFLNGATIENRQSKISNPKSPLQSKSVAMSSEMMNKENISLSDEED